jgi:hypothetical protein
VRAERSSYSGAPAANAAVRERFGLNTGRFPSEVRLSPRVGFSYTFFPDTARAGARDTARAAARGERQAQRAQQGGPGAFLRGGPTFFVRGGVGEFRGRAESPLFSAAQQGSGLAGAEAQLVCAGAAVPLPDYADYLARGDAAIPAACLPAAGAPAASAQQAAPSVTAIADGFRAPRTWRANLGVTRRFWERYTASVDASYTLGVGQSGVRDVNLATGGGFALADEGGRPVFVPAAAIAPTTGAAPLFASRVDPRFAQVYEVASRYRSRNAQATAALNGFTGKGVIFNLSWTVARNRDQAAGGGFGGFGSFGGGGGFGGPAQLFTGTPTAGNPNALAWAPGQQDVRHNVIGTGHLPGAPVVRGHRRGARDERAARTRRSSRATSTATAPATTPPSSSTRPRRPTPRWPPACASSSARCLTRRARASSRSSAAWPAATAAAARGRPGSTSSSTTSPTASASSAASP